ncbi:MAG TPA: alpha/beta hydrolase-fold protein [Thermoanaerobaculia bacterium]|nr:alpha/beta hydrolase-fold protein [Thermoanaerobaculia bacterium]
MATSSFRLALKRAFRRENRRLVIRNGRLEAITFAKRQITLYLPPGYDDHADRRYPVLYMQDGQNLFDPTRSFIPGQTWRLSEAADSLIAEFKARPMIIVGIDNSGAGRIDEYTPTHDAKRNVGGHADDYGRMLLEELKPHIDDTYRTLPDRAGTAVGGSSLGGLLSLHLALTRPQAFSAAAVMSPSVWWDNRVILDELDRFRGRPPRLWLDTGGREGVEALKDVRLLRDRLKAKGFDFRYHEDRRADHSERAWASRAPMMLEYLFPI